MTQKAAYQSLIRNAAFIFGIKLFPALAAVVVLILFSRNLPPDDYGNYQDVWVKIMLIGTVAYAGLPVAIITYSAASIRQFWTHVRSVHILLFIAWIALCSIGVGFLLARLNLPFLLTAGLLLGYVIHAIQESLIIVSKKMSGLLVVNLLYACFFLGIHGYIINQYNLVHLLSWLLGGMLLRSVALLFIILHQYRRTEPAQTQLPDPQRARKLWWHLGFYDLIQTTFRYADKFILSSLLSAPVFAVYFNGVQPAEIPFLPYLLGAVSGSVLIQLSDRQRQQEDGYKLVFQTGKLLSCIVLPLFVFLMLFASELFAVVFAHKYGASVPVFMVAILVLPLRACNYTVLLQHLHQGKIINLGAIGDLLLAVLLMYPLYQWLGLSGVALSFVVSTYLQVLFYVWHTLRLTGIPLTQLIPLTNWMSKLVLSGLLLAPLRFWLSPRYSDSVCLSAGLLGMVLLMLGTLTYEQVSARRTLTS